MSTDPAPAWSVAVRSGSPSDLHADLAERPDPTVWVMDARSPALVLGSTQPVQDVDRRAATRQGLEVIRRRSGGGAVLVVPGELVWCDLVVPRADAAFTDDVSAQFDRAGRRWAAALDRLGADPGFAVQPAGTRPDALGRVVCFGGLGSGEVITAAGAKVVGLSQRRTRAGARVQGLVHRAFRADRTATLMAPGLARLGLDPDEVGARLAATVATADLEPQAVASALADAHPDAPCGAEGER